MKKYYISLISAVLFVGTGLSFANADARNLPGISIVSRADWGADESWRYTARPEYQAMLAKQTQQYVNEADEEAQKESASQSKIATQYAMDHFPNDILNDKTIGIENGNDLWRPLQYKYNKSKIIVHHSAGSMATIKTESDMKALLQSIYKYHSFTHGWGDVGYHFIISPGGVIYEGKAGGEGIVGAHASWNNTPSLGIALIGNFNNEKPTDAQISSLIALITSLAQKYNIDPESKTDRHRKITTYPYVSTFQNYTIVGHRDVGPTECPGTNLYALLPAIRDSVENNLQRVGYIAKVPSVTTSTTSSETTKTIITRPSLPLAANSQKTILALPPIVANPARVYMLHARTANMGTPLPKCQLIQGDVAISGCMYRGGELMVGLKKTNNENPGVVRIVAKSRTSEVTLSVNVARQTDAAIVIPRPYIPVSSSVSSEDTATTSSSQSTNNNVPLSLLEQRKKLFSLPTVSITTKITLPTSADDAPKMMQQNMHVLLYNATTQSSSWTLTCSGACSLSDVPFTRVTIAFTGGMLTVQKNGLVRKEIDLTAVASSGSTIAVSDALTQKQYGIYRGNMDIMQQQVKKLDGAYVSQYALINTLPMSQYLAGIAEASDSEPMEKTKVLALLTKAYALYYVGGSSVHPSIPQGAVYNAIDDPRFFQKYVGVTWEQKSKNRSAAIDATKSEYVVYNNMLPILPYFHCSPGFTWSAREKWGWTDTPYLQSVIDDSGCSTFEGHGVGLSGQGATKKAKDGMKAEDIITYYYPGVQLKVITNQ